MILSINNTALVAYTKKLRTLHRSALPVAVRQTLNSVAFDMKSRTLPASASKTFVQRKPNFFKANSKVGMAKGFKIDGMKSVVGFVPKSQAVKELHEQEYGGTIKDRSFIPNKQARSGGWNTMVKPRFRMARIGGSNIVKASESKGRSDKQKFVRSAIMAKKLHGNNALVLGNKHQGKQTLSKIDKISRNLKRRTIKIKRTAIYTVKKGRSVKISKTGFAKRAAHESGLRISEYYVQHAQKQFQKALR